jgi:predicted aldo/keto reductase-like oxidoreductase
VKYTILGKTGLRVSRLGFGAMRLPTMKVGEKKVVDTHNACEVIHRAFELGVNYIDTAVFYHGQKGEAAVGEALKGWRDKVIVSTKNHYYGEDEKQWWGNLENSLERLGVDYIDIYNHHGLNWKRYSEHVEPRLGKLMLRAREQGLIKHICNSFHDNGEALMKIGDTGYTSAVTVQYNMLDRQLEEAIAHAHAKGVAIIVMGPVGGGHLDSSEVLGNLLPGATSVPELALRFVLSNPGVTVALSGMSTIQQVEENVRTASQDVSLSPDDRAEIEEHLQRLKGMADLYCTGCKYCLPCPQNVSIPRIFKTYNRGRVYGLWDSGWRQYAKFGKGQDENVRADECNECGTCEDKCPQKIPIRKQLKEAHAALTERPAGVPDC